MSFRTVAIAASGPILLLLSLGAISSPLSDEVTLTQQSSATGEQGNGKQVERIDDVNDYLQRVRNVVERAHEGDYGSIRKRDMDRVVAAQQSIDSLLSNREGEIVLSTEEQIQLANAQETINAIIRSDEKSRMICKRLSMIGTRIPKNECLSVAEWEHRAEVARQIVKTSNDFCVPNEGAPGEGNRCTNR